MSIRPKAGAGLPGLLACLLLAACQPPPELAPLPPAGEPVEVLVRELQPQTWRGTISTYGVIEALEEVDVAAELSGTVLAVYVNEGDRVEAGQLLLELDPEKRSFAAEQAGQEAERARAALEEARLRLQRRRNLAEKETISREVLDNAQLAVDSASAAYRQAVASHRLAERELADTRIYSPTAGMVDVRAVEAGEPVAAGAGLVTLQAVHALRVQTWVSEADIANIRAGAGAVVTASGLPGRQYRARVEWLGVNADPATGNFPVKLIMEDVGGSLRPGMTASAVLEGIAVENALLLPERALVDRDRRRVVFVVKEGVARLREPLLAAGFTNRLHVLEGLSPGDLLVVHGQQQLLDGTPVLPRMAE